MKDNETFTEAKARRSKGLRGKRAENLVEKALKELKEASAHFDYDRLPDTRSAGRIMPAQVADFTMLYHGKAFCLEVKEVKKGKRLNIKSAFRQYPRMLRRSMAGATGLLLIFSVEEDSWFILDVLDIPKKVKSFSFVDMAAEALASTSSSYKTLIEEKIGWSSP